MGIRKNCSTGTRFPAHTVMYKLGLPARAKILGTLVGYQGIRSRSWAKAPLREDSEIINFGDILVASNRQNFLACGAIY